MSRFWADPDTRRLGPPPAPPVDALTGAARGKTAQLEQIAAAIGAATGRPVVDVAAALPRAGHRAPRSWRLLGIRRAPAAMRSTSADGGVSGRHRRPDPAEVDTELDRQFWGGSLG